MLEEMGAELSSYSTWTDGLHLTNSVRGRGMYSLGAGAGRGMDQKADRGWRAKAQHQNSRGLPRVRKGKL